MRQRPMPVVMVATLTDAGAEATLQGLELGAVDYVSKPKLNEGKQLEHYVAEITAKIKVAAKARVRGVSGVDSRPSEPPREEARRHFKTTDMIIAIGASTGGTEALKDIIGQLPPWTPGIVVTQHIPVTFSKQFAARMNDSSEMTFCEAGDGQRILPGHGYIAPGDRHLAVVRDGSRFACRLLDSAPVNRHIPSVEVLFRSVAESAGPNSLGILLTGMGADGAEAMGEMQRAGAPTIAQDEASSVVWGMPGEAVKRGYADEVQPLDKIAARILYYVDKHG
jgi:two-component system chemotaxis response regulator CheB